MSVATQARRPFTITRLAVRNGVLSGFVSIDGGATVPVERRGGWLAFVRPYPGARERVIRCVLPDVAAELQKRARSLEQSVRCGAEPRHRCATATGVAHRERLDAIEAASTGAAEAAA